MTNQLTLPATDRPILPWIRGEAPEPTEKDHVPPDPEEQEEAEQKDERVQERKKREEAEENQTGDG